MLAYLDEVYERRKHEGRLNTLTDLFGIRGLRLPADSARYILRRCPRNLGYLQGLLERLDNASLAAQRRLTLPFVREQLRRHD